MVEINNENKEVLLAVYGTLRRGQGNWDYLLNGNSEFVGTTTTPPEYTMYGKRSGFPIVAKKGNTSIEIDVFKVTNNEVLRRVHGLESCSGIPGDPRNWYDIQPIETEFGKAYIYLQNNYENPTNIIESGNWLNR